MKILSLWHDDVFKIPPEKKFPKKGAIWEFLM